MERMNHTETPLRRPKELARATSMSYSMIIEYLQKGMIRGVRFNTAWRIPADEFERVLREGVQPARKEPS